MKQIIYIDVLIAVNLFINYFILIAVAKFLYIKVNRFRIILGSLLGALYSLYILLPEMNIFVSFIIKLLMSATIVWVSFCMPKSSTYLKAILCFYSMNFAFSGLMFALWCTFAPKGLSINNGIVYFNISPLILVISTVISYIVIQTINKILSRQHDKRTFCNIKLCIENKELNLRAKVDTGHNLREPFSGLPVIVTCSRKIQNILPKGLLEVLNNSHSGSNYIQSCVCNKIRLIPFTSISGAGLLPAFKLDYVLISNIKKEAYVAVCPDENIKEEFDALISPEMTK